MKTQAIPDPIATAAANMLALYHPGLTPEKLQAALKRQETTEQPKDQLITRKEACELLRLSLPTIDRMLASGELIKVKIRGRAFIRLFQVDALTQGKEYFSAAHQSVLKESGKVKLNG